MGKRKLQLIENSNSGDSQTLSFRVPLPNRQSYFICENEIIKLNRDGEIIQRFSPLPVVLRVEKCADAPAGQQHIYTVRIGKDEKRLSHAEFAEPSWTDNFSELHGNADKKTRELYFDVIKFLASSERTEKLFIRQRTGFHTENNGGLPIYGYLTPQDFITAPQQPWAEEIKLINSEGRYSENSEPTEEIDAKGAVELLKQINQITPYGHLLIGLVNNVCILTSLLRPKYDQPGHTLIIYGEPGSGKTSLASAIRCSVYDYNHRAGVDASFRDTITSIEKKIDSRPHVPFVLDDLRKEAGETAAALAAKYHAAEMIVGAAYTHEAVRERCTNKLESRKPNFVKTLPIITSEFLPIEATDAFFRRVLIMRLERGGIHLTTQGDTLGLDYLPNIAPKLKALHAKAARLVVSLLNAKGDREPANAYGKKKSKRSLTDKVSSYESMSEKLSELSRDYREQFLRILAEKIPVIGEADVRQNICSICGDLMSAAKFIDAAVGTKNDFAEVTFIALLQFIEFQVNFINERHGRAHGRKLIDEILWQFFESLNNGILHEGQYLEIPALPSESTYSDRAEHKKQYGYREYGKNIEVGWLDTDKDRFIVSNLMQKHLARIASEISSAEYSVSDIYEFLEKAGYIANKSKRHGERSKQYRLRGCDKEFAYGWHLYADKVLALLGSNDE
jgi:hypothetical protein